VLILPVSTTLHTILIGLWNYSDGVVFLRKKNWGDFFLFYKNNSLFYYAHTSVKFLELVFILNDNSMRIGKTCYV
jgi:hypothetical protein